MSFSSDVKNEILSKNIKYNDFLPFLSGLIKSSGEFVIKNKELSIEIKTELPTLLKSINWFFKKKYGLEATMRMVNEPTFSLIRYSITIIPEITNKLLYDTKIYNNEDEITWGIDDIFFETHASRIAFIKGVFIGCATSNIVLEDDKNSGSHLEFVFSNETLAFDFLEMLSHENIIAKKVKRKNLYIVYLQTAKGCVSDFIGKLEANDSFLKMQNKIAYRNLMNNVNRQANCDKGNITKTVEASLKQVKAIEVIEETIGISSLPNNLQEICLLRLVNREESLADLVKLSKTKISRSGLNHRLNKIIEIAKNLKN